MPNWFVDISDTFDLKLAALEAYAAELRPWPHPRSKQGVEYLARWRGATIGTEAAEAFMLGRQLARMLFFELMRQLARVLATLCVVWRWLVLCVSEA